MVGTLIKTMTNEGLFIGIIKHYYYCDDDNEISISVHWSDNDDTTESFVEYGHYDYDEHEYCFYNKGRWWRVDENFYKFKRLLENKCE